MRGYDTPLEDERPVIGECEECGQPIYGEDYTHYGDVYYAIDNIMLHDDCMQSYMDRHYRKGG